MHQPDSGQSVLHWVAEWMQDMEASDERLLSGELRLDDKKVRVPAPQLPLQLQFGAKDGIGLQLVPDIVMDAEGRCAHDGGYLLVDPVRFFGSISGFLRLQPGRSLALDGHDPKLGQWVHDPKAVADVRLRLKLTKKGLSFKNRATNQSVRIAPLVDRASIERLQEWRKHKLRALATVLQAPIEEPTGSASLDLIEQVIKILRGERYRLKGSDGRPGSMLRLPARVTPIIVGDLHACIDNLLVILTQNAFLDALTQGTAMLILLGDAVHPDAPGQEAEMQSSLWMMDLIFRLKVRFPERVFYLRGNHDSFAEDIGKGGVPQGLLWEQALRDTRGKRYRNAMQRLYNRLPYMAFSSQYICCHAGAPTMKTSRTDLINAWRKPKLQAQLTRLRPRHSRKPDGYGSNDVRRLRKTLDLAPETPLIVGHTPHSGDDTLWWDAGGIKAHVVLFGANPAKIGVITRLAGELAPLTYPVEPLMGVYNRLVKTGQR